MDGVGAFPVSGGLREAGATGDVPPATGGFDGTLGTGGPPPAGMGLGGSLRGGSLIGAPGEVWGAGGWDEGGLSLTMEKEVN